MTPKHSGKDKTVQPVKTLVVARSSGEEQEREG